MSNLLIGIQMGPLQLLLPPKSRLSLSADR